MPQSTHVSRATAATTSASRRCTLRSRGALTRVHGQRRGLLAVRGACVGSRATAETAPHRGSLRGNRGGQGLRCAGGVRSRVAALARASRLRSSAAGNVPPGTCGALASAPPRGTPAPRHCGGLGSGAGRCHSGSAHRDFLPGPTDPDTAVRGHRGDLRCPFVSRSPESRWR